MESQIQKTLEYVWNNIPLSLRNSLTRNNHKSTLRSFFFENLQ